MSYGATVAIVAGFAVFAFAGYRLGKKQVLSSIDGEIQKIQQHIEAVALSKDQYRVKLQQERRKYSETLEQVTHLREETLFEISRYYQDFLEKTDQEVQKRTHGFKERLKSDTLNEIEHLKASLVKELISQLEAHLSQVSSKDNHKYTTQMLESIDAESMLCQKEAAEETMTSSNTLKTPIQD